VSRTPAAGPESQYIVRMFGAIADHYDLMNRVMTLGQDGRWRRQAADVAKLSPGHVALDVACGTGDLSFELARRVQPNGHVIGIDVAEPMLQIARRKARLRSALTSFRTGNALDLQYDDKTFDAVVCGFGLRNVVERQLALQEMTRVVRPLGRVVVLELTPPRNVLARGYMDDIIPRLGQFLAGAREAYTYLPQSAHGFPGPERLARMMQEAGLSGITYRLLNFGTVALHWGTRTRP
jgi:demethylmenaquinone methyltransferase / 2-methoxy-6-polyprenyl-1,4-benzoquinol methylase